MASRGSPAGCAGAVVAVGAGFVGEGGTVDVAVGAGFVGEAAGGCVAVAGAFVDVGAVVAGAACVAVLFGGAAVEAAGVAGPAHAVSIIKATATVINAGRKPLGLPARRSGRENGNWLFDGDIVFDSLLQTSG